MRDTTAARTLLTSAQAGCVLAATALVALAACGSDDDSSSSVQRRGRPRHVGPAGRRELAGIVRDPAPVVDATPLPSLTDPGDDVVFRADPGGSEAVYFGYTNCPDVCPTTMADWAVALRRLPPELAERVGTVMVTVDPERDNELLPGYVRASCPTPSPPAPLDADRLAAAAEPFGVSYAVTTNAEGEIEVYHSGFLYLVDDDGRLLVTWPFGPSSKEMAADIQQLFDTQAARSRTARVLGRATALPVFAVR